MSFRDDVWWELRYALRSFRTAPSFIALIVLTLVLGVSANGAVYTLIDRLFVGTPKGVSGAEVIKRVHQRFTPPLSRRPVVRDAFSYPEWESARNSLPHRKLAGFVDAAVMLGDYQSSAERVGFVVGDYFGALGVRPVAGRALLPDEIRNGAAVAVLGYELWHRKFGGDPDVIGKLLDIAGARFTIVGVAPPGFNGVGLNATQAWLPYDAPGNPANPPGSRSSVRDLRITMFVRAGSVGELDALRNTVERALRAVNATFDTTASIDLVGIGQRLDAGRTKAEFPALTALAGSAAAILLMACVNATILILVRATRRQRETAVRFALGITRARLTIQAAVEALLIAANVMLFSTLATWWTGGILRQRLLPSVEWGGPPINTRVVVAIGTVGTAAALMAALLPTWLAHRKQIWHGIREGGSATAFSSRIRGTLLASQAGLVVLLLTVAMVFVATLRNVAAVPTGYDADEVLVVTPPEQQGSGRTLPATAALLADWQRDLSAHPAVDAAALAFSTPVVTINFASLYGPRGDSLAPTLSAAPTATISAPEFLRVLGIKVVQGRAFSAGDIEGSPPVILVSEFTARALWPGTNAVGRCLVVFRRDGPCRQVIGVVDDIRSLKLLEPPSVKIFLPLAQAPKPFSQPGVMLVRPKAGAQREVIAKLRSSMTGDVAAWRIDRFGDLFHSELQPFRTRATLFSVLAILGISLAALGIYGSVSHVVNELSPAIGIRRALGANGLQVSRLVMRRAVAPVLMGAFAGFLVVVSFSGLQTQVLYNTSAASPGVVIGVCAGVLLITIIACLAPFSRALRVSPRSVIASE